MKPSVCLLATLKTQRYIYKNNKKLYLTIWERGQPPFTKLTLKVRAITLILNQLDLIQPYNRQYNLNTPIALFSFQTIVWSENTWWGPWYLMITVDRSTLDGDLHGGHLYALTVVLTFIEAAVSTWFWYSVLYQLTTYNKSQKKHSTAIYT